jgi:hypothetical protein
MQFYSGPLMHFLSGVDNRKTRISDISHVAQRIASTIGLCHRHANDAREFFNEEGLRKLLKALWPKVL